MDKYFSKKLIFTLSVIASSIIVLTSAIQFYLEYRDYSINSEKMIKTRVERIASSILPSVWELYSKSVQRKFSDDFSFQVLDSEIKGDGVDAIVIRGQFGHFYMGRFKDPRKNMGQEVLSFKDLADYQNRFKKGIYSFPIRNGSMTIGSVEVVRNDTVFRDEFRRKILVNILETLIITAAFILLTIYGVNKSLMKPLKEISLAKKTINILNEGVIFLDENFIIRETNSSALEMLNKTSKSLIGSDGLKAFELDADVISKSLNLEKFLELETEINISGVDKFFKIYIVDILDINGVFISYALKFQDVSELRRAMNSLTKAKEEAELANSRKSSFLANMSHEIRSPLNSICGLSDFIVENDDLSEVELVESLKSINTSSTHLLSVINDIIDFSKIEESKVTLERHEFCLKQKVAELMSVFKVPARSKGIEISFDGPSGSKYYIGDSYRLTQIIMNLLSNAIKFTSKGEVKVVLTTSSIDASRDEVLIEVVDNGIGVQEDSVELLFTPYLQADESTTRKFGGTGLGLSISRELAELFGGELGYRPNPDGGSIFYFSFPLDCAKERLQEKVSLPESTPALQDLKILIVDDEKVNRTLLQLYFKKEKSIDLSVALDGKDGLETYKREHPDIVLLDLQMPVMDGQESLKRIRQYEVEQKLKPAIIIMVSANTLSDSTSELLSSGADSYLYKPVNSTKLKQEIVKLLYKV